MDVSGCSLYDGWPNFTCATSVMVPEQWLNSPTNTSITWPGNNGATITLSNISLDSLDAFPGTSTLVMKLAIQSGYGEFCPNAFANYSLGVVTDEKGDVVRPMQPLPTESSTCMGPNETSMIHVIIPFVSSNFPLTVQTFTQNGGRQTFFNVYPLLDHTIVVTPAPSS